jgi:hypothetical protein
MNNEIPCMTSDPKIESTVDFDIPFHEINEVVYNEETDTWEAAYGRRATEITIEQWKKAPILKKGYEISRWPRVYEDDIIIVFFTRKKGWLENLTNSRLLVSLMWALDTASGHKHPADYVNEDVRELNRQAYAEHDRRCKENLAQKEKYYNG